MKRTGPGLVLALAAVLGVSACTNPYDPGQRTIAGGLGGAALGASIGALAGGGGGAAVGAIAGATLGTIGGAATTPQPPPPVYAQPYQQPGYVESGYAQPGYPVQPGYYYQPPPYYQPRPAPYGYYAPAYGY